MDFSLIDDDYFFFLFFGKDWFIRDRVLWFYGFLRLVNWLIYHRWVVFRARNHPRKWSATWSCLWGSPRRSGRSLEFRAGTFTGEKQKIKTQFYTAFALMIGRNTFQLLQRFRYSWRQSMVCDRDLCSPSLRSCPFLKSMAPWDRDGVGQVLRSRREMFMLPSSVMSLPPLNSCHEMRLKSTTKPISKANVSWLRHCCQ